MRSALQESDRFWFGALLAVKRHSDEHTLSHEQIELDTSVFYIGLGDQFDDDRRRIRPA
jgi:hypothetical protein